MLFGFAFWIYKIYKLYRQKRIKIALINSAILCILTLVICWELRLIPLAIDLDFRNQTQELTGKEFWCWNDYRYDEIGVRGEGFTFEIYKLDDKIANYFRRPDKVFFESFPANKFETTKWKKTPIVEMEIVDFVTPKYGNWSEKLKNEIIEKQNLVKQISREQGSYYAFRNSHGTDLYLISPKKKIIIFINHNM
jgi:hypothetical protein